MGRIKTAWRRRRPGKDRRIDALKVSLCGVDRRLDDLSWIILHRRAEQLRG